MIWSGQVHVKWLNIKFPLESSYTAFGKYKKQLFTKSLESNGLEVEINIAASSTEQWKQDKPGRISDYKIRTKVHFIRELKHKVMSYFQRLLGSEDPAVHSSSAALYGILNNSWKTFSKEMLAKHITDEEIKAKLFP